VLTGSPGRFMHNVDSYDGEGDTEFDKQRNLECASHQAARKILDFVAI
jgi:hypothetical protein